MVFSFWDQNVLCSLREIPNESSNFMQISGNELNSLHSDMIYIFDTSVFCDTSDILQGKYRVSGQHFGFAERFLLSCFKTDWKHVERLRDA